MNVHDGAQKLTVDFVPLLPTHPLQYVRSCYSEIPIDPADFLPQNYTLYTTSLSYICFDHLNQNLSVLGELIRYPASGQLNDAFVSNNFEYGLNLPVGQCAAAYPGLLLA